MAGVIDQDYTGEVFVLLINHDDKLSHQIRPEDKVVQLIPQERTLITRVITRDKCSQTQDEVCSEETVKVDGRQILSQAECKKQFQLICRAVRQFKAITRAAEYIRRTFNEIKREFLSVIDHLETEAEEKDPRERRQSNEKVQEELKIAYSRVSIARLQEVDTLDDTERSPGGVRSLKEQSTA